MNDVVLINNYDDFLDCVKENQNLRIIYDYDNNLFIVGKLEKYMHVDLQYIAELNKIKIIPQYIHLITCNDNSEALSQGYKNHITFDGINIYFREPNFLNTKLYQMIKNI